MFAVVFLVAVASAIPMALHRFPDAVSAGAVCLDGSGYAFYHSPATKAENANDWQIYFQGGGWCYDEMDCWGRSSTALGSSKSWAATADMTGLVSDNCTINPDFCNYNRVLLMYCDGNSFSGNRSDAVVVNGKPLYFRGHYIVNFALEKLFKDFKLGDAKNVLLTGCSAGGLATYLHTDYVGDILAKYAKNLVRYKAASISGFFLLHNTVLNIPVYPIQMKNIHDLSEADGGLNAACVAATAPANRWMCNFAQYSYQYTKYPIMVLNSALDSWQTMCIYTSVLPPNFPNQTGTENGMCAAAPGWANCAENPSQCTTQQLPVMRKYESDFMAIIGNVASYTKPGNGAFIHSYHTHCEAQSDQDFTTFQINGVTMQQAVSLWWNSPLSTPAANNTRVCVPWPNTCASEGAVVPDIKEISRASLVAQGEAARQYIHFHEDK